MSSRHNKLIAISFQPMHLITQVPVQKLHHNKNFLMWQFKIDINRSTGENLRSSGEKFYLNYCILKGCTTTKSYIIVVLKQEDKSPRYRVIIFINKIDLYWLLFSKLSDVIINYVFFGKRNHNLIDYLWKIRSNHVLFDNFYIWTVQFF